MRRYAPKLLPPSRYIRWLHTSNRTRCPAVHDGTKPVVNHLHDKTHLLQVEKLFSSLDAVDISEFRQRAFLPERPILITRDYKDNHGPEEKIAYPAATKWFEKIRERTGRDELQRSSLVPSQGYLSRFAETLLPYETIIQMGSPDVEAFKRTWPPAHHHHLEAFLYEAETAMRDKSLASRFFRFNAPLSLFLEAYKPRPAEFPQIRQLYIAQAQIPELPKELQDDLPTPTLVNEAGKGDLYDTSIWMGLPPTYTPLHKDPNPNLFLQLAGQKVARLYKPAVGAAIFREVQRHIGAYSSATFRGQEMMEGAEAKVLEEAIWGSAHSTDGIEAIVNPGDALFIPKGWWHSIRSHHTGARDVTASVNWWFR